LLTESTDNCWNPFFFATTIRIALFDKQVQSQIGSAPCLFLNAGVACSKPAATSQQFSQQRGKSRSPDPGKD
jgi:hypothetical protein